VPLLYVGAAASARVSAEWPLCEVSAASAPLLYGLGQSALHRFELNTLANLGGER